MNNILKFDMPKVSVIVPMYNSARFLKRCVDSLINQTLKDIEIILVNDASPDNSLDIAREYELIDNRVKVIDSPINIVASRNLGIKAAKSEYLGFVDADDWVSPTMYEDMYNATEDETIDCVVGGYNYVYPNRVEYDTNISNESFVDSELIKKEVSIKGGRLFTNLWRKSLIVEDGLFFMEHNLYCDAIVNLWYLKAKTFRKLDKPYYNYYINTISITAKRDFMRFFDRLASADDMLIRAKQIGLYNEYKDFLDMRYYLLYLKYTLIGSKRNFSKFPVSKVRDCVNHFKSQYKLSDISYLKANSDVYDKYMPLIMVFPRFGFFVASWMFRITHFRSLLKRKFQTQG